MTERKPPEARFEDWVERQIRTAQERGAFDDLPGAGRPIPGLDRPMTTADWAVEWARRSEADLTAALPLSLALRRERQDLLEAAAQQGSPEQVRALVEGFNARLRAAYLRPADGPPLALGPLDADRLVERWHAAHPPAPEAEPPPEAPARARRWRHRLRSLGPRRAG